MHDITWIVCPAIDKTWEKKRMHTGALQLTKVLAESDTTWKDDSFKAEDRTISLEKEDSSLDDSTTIYIKIERKQSDTTEQVYTGCRGRDGTTSYSTPLLTGVSEGIVDIFDAIIDAHPQAFEHVSENEENILHVAIRYRQREIFRRVKKMEMIMKYRLASRIDVRGYTILHEVADMGKYNGGKIPGPAFQLQDELKWLEVLTFIYIYKLLTEVTFVCATSCCKKKNRRLFFVASGIRKKKSLIFTLMFACSVCER